MSAHLSVAAATDRSAWETVVATYNDVCARWAACPYRDLLFDDPGYAEAEAQENAFCQQSAEAIKNIILTPSPDVAALIEKLEITKAEDGFGVLPSGADGLAAILADVRRLSGQGGAE